MMEESPEEAAKREEMLRMYHACKEALSIIGTSIKLCRTTKDPGPMHLSALVFTAMSMSRQKPIHFKIDFSSVLR